MSKSALLTAVGGLAPRKTIFHEQDGKTFIETRQECSHLVEAAKVLAEVPPSKEDGWRFLCVIPDAVVNQAMIEGWFHDKTRWRQWANNRDNRAFNGGREYVS